MHILGFCNGSVGGNTETLLKIALTEAEAQDPTNITISWIHAPSVVTPRNPPPLPGTTHDLIQGGNKSITQDGSASQDVIVVDDREAIRNAILDADAIIVSSSTQSHAPPGNLKVILDLIGGPHMDAATVRLAVEKKLAGDPSYANFSYDERLLKPRVLAFVATGGSRSPDQYSQVLPNLHLLFFSLHAKVVDQFVAKGFLTGGSVLISREVVERTKLLGRNVVSQLGRSFEEAEYLGEEEEGACLFCHLRAVEFLSSGTGNEIGCVTCGATGRMIVRDDGRILPEWDRETVWSCESLVGKVKHSRDVGLFMAEEKPKLAGIQEERKRWAEAEVPVVPLPSHDAARKGVL